MLEVFTHPACRAHDVPEGTAGGQHPERPERLPAFLSGLRRFEGPVREQDAPEASTEQLTRVHTPDHVKAVERACGLETWIDQDTYARQESWEAAVRAAGGAIEAARSAVDGERAIAAVRPPGHHARSEGAMGFCLFNNVAIAAETLASEGQSVAIVDIDVHHGNGTQEIFYEREDVLYASIHQAPFYPGTGQAHEVGQGPGEGATVNLPVPAGTGHEGWLELVDRVVVPVLDAYQPEAILVSAGYDADHRDPIGGLELSAPTVHACIQRLLGVQPRVAVVLEGGYSLPALEAGALATISALAGEPCGVEEPLRPGVRPWGMLRSSIASHLSERWPVHVE